MKKAILVLSLVMFVAIAFSPVALAQDFEERTPSSPIEDVSDFYGLLETVFTFMYSIFFAVATFFILFAAFLYLTAAGDDAKLGKAKNVLIYAVIAIVVALIALGIDNVVEGIITG